MSAVQMLVDIFQQEMLSDMPVLTLGRTSVTISPLTEEEKRYVNRVFNKLVESLRKRAPSIAASIEAQRSIAHKVAQIAKGMLGNKPITYPSKVGGIGVNPLIPQVIKYVATPNSDNPAYTDYPANSWDLTLTPGTNVYLLGSSTNYFKYPNIQGRRAIAVIFMDGVVEVGTTPKLSQFRYLSEASTEWGVYNTFPLVEVPVEYGKAIYQYSTPGVLILWYDFGVKWYAMPIRGGTSTIELVGLIFYEHDFMSDTKYVS